MKSKNKTERLLKHWRIEMHLIETTAVEAATKQEALEKACEQGFGGTTIHVKTVAKLLKDDS